ncbi:MAG: hypothetical protein KBD78_06430 [Oligoflexales bacterium]|nr:hypothetical protein [Oligoflexales bacterium]
MSARGPLNFYAIHGKIIATGSGIPPSPVPLALMATPAEPSRFLKYVREEMFARRSSS